MNNDDSRCIHIERDGKAIEFGYLNISSTDRNTSHTDGLMSIFDGNFSGVWVRGVTVFLNGPDNLDATLVGNLSCLGFRDHLYPCPKYLQQGLGLFRDHDRFWQMS